MFSVADFIVVAQPEKYRDVSRDPESAQGRG